MAVNAGFTSLASQAAISFINNGGDLARLSMISAPVPP